MSNDAGRLDTTVNHGQSSTRTAAHEEKGAEEEASKKGIAQFKKTHALKGVLFLSLWFVPVIFPTTTNE
jgi:hypothetical protein